MSRTVVKRARPIPIITYLNASPAPEPNPPSHTIPITSKVNSASQTSSVFHPIPVKYGARCTSAQSARIAAQEHSTAPFMEQYFAQFRGQRSCPLETYSNTSATSVRPARGFCVEAMTSTFQVVSQMYKELAWDATVEVIR